MAKMRSFISFFLLCCVVLGISACAKTPAAPGIDPTASLANTPSAAPLLSAAPMTTPIQGRQTETPPVPPLNSVEGMATAQAQAMYSFITDLQSKGVTVSKQGTYHKLEDHTITVVDPYTRTLDNIEGFFLSNFILRADLSWNKPDVRMIDKDNSGCGFAFHLNTDGDYDMKIRIDGSAALHRIENDTQYTYKAYTLRNEPYRSQFVSQGSEKIILVVNQNLVTLLADDHIIFQVEDEQFTSEIYGKGLIAYLTENSQVGGEMVCTWTNAELWEISPNTGANAQSEQATTAPTPVLEAEDYYNQGVSFYKKGNYSHAIDAFTKAIDLAPSVYVSYFSRGILQYVRGDYPAALKDFNRAIELAPDLAVAYYRRAQVYEKAGDQEKADADYKKADDLGYKP